MTISAELEECYATAQQVITCALNGDRDLAIGIMRDAESPTGVALALADTAAFMHREWGKATAKLTRRPITEEHLLGAWRIIIRDMEAQRDEWRRRQP